MRMRPPDPGYPSGLPHLAGRTLGRLFLTTLLLGAIGCSGDDDEDDDASGSSPPPLSQQIQVSRTSLEFGEVTVGDHTDEQLEVTNNGESPLLLTVTTPLNPAGQYSVSSDGGPVPDELEAGATVSLTVRFTATEPGQAAGSLRVDSTDPVAPRIDVALTATAEGGGGIDADDDGFTVADGDCDDTDPEVNPDAPEACDEIDNDCDDEVDEAGLEFYRDADQDGYGTDELTLPGAVAEGCEPPPGYAGSHDDCDDLEPDVHPGAEESCDTADNDCDGSIDENGESTFYVDADSDGYGDPSTAFVGCDPGPGSSARGDDCDDSSEEVHPEAEELCDGRDNDCDDGIDEEASRTFYEDRDGDGFGDDESTATGCTPLEGYADVGGDCNDADAGIHPDALEVCDGLDNDCDGATDGAIELTFYRDEDGDLHGDPDDFISACAAPTGYVEDGDDCDDDDAASHPGAEEQCDGRDNDCDGSIDEGLTSTFYTDGDGDGHGDGDRPVQACGPGEGRATTGDDCDDTDDSVHPDATERCDSQDNDCDGQVDENGVSTFYLDYDEDGHGDPAITREGCNNPGGYVAAGDDCNDRNAAVYPGATETCNGRDDDCDEAVDEEVVPTWYLDADRDGYGNPEATLEACSKPASYTDRGGDCDDLDPSSNPAGKDICDGADNNCDGSIDEGVLETFYADEDGDGYGDRSAPTEACSAPAGTSDDSSDCDDSRADVHPGAAEACDGADNDCDTSIDEGVRTTWYLDADGDGHGVSSSTKQACAAPAGYVATATDCDDGDAAVHPGATEVCDGSDDNCNGQTDEGVQKTFYADADEDGYGDASSTTRACTVSSGYVASGTDCDDGDETVFPGAPERCDSQDNDCDNSIDEAGDASQTAWYLDQDGDGYGVTSVVKYACTKPAGYTSQPGDCLDADEDSYPGAPELCEGKDNDCNGEKSPPTAPSAGNNGPVCVGATLNLTAGTVAGATYSWTGPNGFSSSLQNPVRNNMTPADAGTYRVTVTKDGCTSAATSTVVSVNDPSADFDWSPATPKKNEAVTFTPVLTTAQRYAWSFQSGSPSTSSATSPTVSWSAGGSFAVSLTVTKDGCSSTSLDVITVIDSYPSCKAYKEANAAAPSGTYQIDPDGTGGNAPFSVYCEMTTAGGGWTRCLDFQNTSGEDMANNNWFDACVDYAAATWTGNEVMIKLVNSSSATVYSAYGSTANTWTYNQITSTVEPGSQYYSPNHNYMISLNNSDRLMIAGKNASNSGCGGSMGNGYGITLYPANPDYYSNPKAFIMPYRHLYSGGGARSFSGWSTGHEITYNGGSSYNSCNGIPSGAAFTGRFEFYVR